MASYKYKNTSGQELALIGYGIMKPGGQVMSAVPIENPNLELMESEPEPVVSQEPTPSPEQSPSEEPAPESENPIPTEQPNQTQE